MHRPARAFDQSLWSRPNGPDPCQVTLTHVRASAPASALPGEIYELADRIAERHMRTGIKGSFMEPQVERLRPAAMGFDHEWKDKTQAQAALDLDRLVREALEMAPREVLEMAPHPTGDVTPGEAGCNVAATEHVDAPEATDPILHRAKGSEHTKRPTASA